MLLQTTLKASNSPVISGLKLLGVSLWPVSKEDLPHFGEEEVNCLISHYESLLEINDVE